MSSFWHTLHTYARASSLVLAENLWPTRCCVCDTPGFLLCPNCARTLPYIDTWRACKRCGSPFGSIQCCECNSTLMERMQRSAPGYDACASAVMFNEASARCVRAWKDAGERRMSQVLASVMAPYVQPHWMSENPCVVAIPASKQAQRRRGFDHGQELAYAVARELGLNSCALLAPPHTNDQRKLDRQGRLNNLKKRFTVNSFSSVPESVLMVDDVHTTGATLFAAGDALHEAGVKHVYALTFARVW